MLLFATSVPDCPPSPPTDSNQLPVPFALKAKVPLSCVPPRISFKGFFRFTERLWNCSVTNPLFMLKICVGMAASHIRQSVRFVPVIPRLSQSADASANDPL